MANMLSTLAQAEFHQDKTESEQTKGFITFINKKIDELFIKLEKLGYGQQIIFDELEELKDLYLTLNKQNWAQLVKGKIIDLGLSQVISVDVMKIIYESITNDILRIP